MKNNDLISRSTLFEAWDALDETQDPNLLVDAMIKTTQEAPAVDAEPVRCGEWIINNVVIDNNGRTIPDRPKCSECGKQSDLEYDYCPNCGAKMDAEVEA